MFDSLSSGALRAAHDAARLLYANREALRLDVQAIKLDTLAADICAALEIRGEPVTTADEAAPAG